MATVTDPHGVDLDVPDDKVHLYARLGWGVPEVRAESKPRGKTRSATKAADSTKEA